MFNRRDDRLTKLRFFKFSMKLYVIPVFEFEFNNDIDDKFRTVIKTIKLISEIMLGSRLKIFQCVLSNIHKICRDRHKTDITSDLRNLWLEAMITVFAISVIDLS